MPAASPLDPVPQGRVAGQWTYDAYGSVTSADALQAFPPVHAGHKGLFYERLDSSSVNGLALTPLSKGVYHCRNRVHDPYAGRFLTRDPNATGQVVAGIRFGGGSPEMPFPQDVDSQEVFSGSMNTTGYVGGKPLAESDPSGLVFEFIPMTVDMYNSAADALNTAHMGNMMSFALGGLTRAYAVNQLLDAEALDDWSLPDEALSFHASNTQLTREQLFGHFESTMARSGGIVDTIPTPTDAIAAESGPGTRPVKFSSIDGSQKQHGKADHWHAIRARALQLAGDDDVVPGSIRINRAARDKDGKVIDKRRPDLQWMDREGNTHVQEVYDS